MVNPPLSGEPLSERLDKVIGRIVKFYQPQRIVLFGSYAYGLPHPDSDLDLLIVKQTDERPIDRRVAVRTLLRELRSHPSVSALVVTPEEMEEQLNLGNPFAQEIVSRGKVIYESN